MKFEIKHRYTAAILFSVETDTLKLALQLAIKSGANLSGANLSGAYLSGAYLSGANLSGAYLSGADLSRADLSRAYLSGANLSGADLSRAYLSGANLSGAYLSGANLSGANLSGADLSGAYLSGANLSGAYLSGAKNAEVVLARLKITPEGDLIGWKKLRDDCIAKLLIPAAARRLNAYSSRKCRAEFAMCLEITGPKGGARTSGESLHDSSFQYHVGKPVVPESFDPGMTECSAGIHFFITREEAEAYS